MRVHPKTVEREFQDYIARRRQQELPWKVELAHPYFEQLWHAAHQAGEAAMQTCAESPGWCSVHVHVPDSLFSEWLVKTGKAKYDADFAGKQRAVRIYEFRREGVHDCARLEAYVEAFVRVLAAAGVDAYTESELD